MRTEGLKEERYYYYVAHFSDQLRVLVPIDSFYIAESYFTFPLKLLKVKVNILKWRDLRKQNDISR